MTSLLYLDNTYLFESSATVLRTEQTEHGLAIVLDQTIFYPQGGGQPADHGLMKCDNGMFDVQDARLDSKGVVYHFGVFESGTFNDGDAVDLSVDQDRRLLHARLHSAGHLLDDAVVRVGIERIVPTKGFHFAEGPYVQYDGVIEEPSQYVEAVEQAVNQLVTDDLQTFTEVLSPEQAAEQDIAAPPGKSARIVWFDGCQKIGCGGTHVRTTSEIGKIGIRKISSKKGVTKISYEIA